MLTQLVYGLAIITQIVPLSGLIGPLRFEFSAENIGQFTEDVVDVPTQVFQTNPPTKVGTSLGLLTTAQSAVVYDPSSQTVLFSKESQAVRPIASLTKFMTALVFLDYNPGLATEAEFQADDFTGGGVAHFKAGDKLTVENLLYTSLIASDNDATMALARSTGLPREKFIEEMNNRAEQLGLLSTHYAEPTGLDEKNVSTALDTARLIDYALNNTLISQIVTLPEYSFELLSSRDTKRFENTDQLIDSLLQLDGGKTGFTHEAGYCFGARFRNSEGQPVVTVVLGSESIDTRFQEVKGLTYWAWENWRWTE